MTARKSQSPSAKATEAKLQGATASQTIVDDPHAPAVPVLLADGIHFGLSDELYHADPALGSSNIRRLRQSVFEFWYESTMNPQRPRAKETDALVVGKAVHKIVLEGRKPFDAAYVRRPDDDEGATGSEKGATTKAANAAAEKIGKESLHGDDYDRALVAGAIIHQHPDLEGAFTNGMPEVSLFFTDAHGVRQKVRWDYLKIRGFGDIKTIANERRKPIAEACRWAIKDYRLDMQMGHYLRGRTMLARLVGDGAVFGDHDATWLKKVAASKEHAGQLVFLQKTGAPLVWSRVFSIANPAVKIALDHVDEGLAAFRRCMAEYGPTEMWSEVPPVEEFSADEMPPSFNYV